MAPRRPAAKPRTETDAEYIKRLEDELLAKTISEAEPADDQPAPTAVAQVDRQPLNLAGCLQPLMIALMFFTILYVVWDSKRTPPAPPQPVPVVVPVNNLTAYTEPIRLKLTSDPAKAKVVAAAYTGLRDALAGAAGARVTDSRIFETVSRSFLTDLNTAGGVAVGTEIDNAIGSYLGMTRSNDLQEPGWEPKQFGTVERAKLVEIVGAIALAAESVQ